MRFTHTNWLLPLFSLTALLVFAPPAVCRAERNRAPVIRHEPVRAVAAGQSISIRATVTDDAGKVKTVVLHYSTSRDTAPFRLTMESAGAGVFMATIPGDLIRDAGKMTYYIEATDNLDATAETAWYTVRINLPSPAGTGTSDAKETGWSWKKKALVGGGAALIGAGVIAASSGGGGGGGDDGGGGNGSLDVAGSYVGTVTTCEEVLGSAPACASRGMRILVTSDGVVSSDTLLENRYLEARLSNGDFSMTAPINTTNHVGQIRYDGTVVSGRITGLISGTFQTLTGDQGVYSGTFSASRPSP